MRTTDGEAASERVSRGVRMMASDLRIPDFVLELTSDGPQIRGGNQLNTELRTDTWPYWAREAIDAAIAADEAAAQIPATLAQFETGDATEEALDELVERELIATMRSIGASAFAIDAFYAAVKARSPLHPDAATWRANRTARHTQVTETLFYHLKIGNQKIKTEIRQRVSTVFEFRDKAVHPASEYKPPLYRPDLNVALDEVFTVFRSENALGATQFMISVLDYCVSRLSNGTPDLEATAPRGRVKMDALLDRYDAAGIFAPYPREVPGAESGSALTN